MCGRYQLKDTDALNAYIRRLFDIPEWVAPLVAARYNVVPSQTMPVLVADEHAKPTGQAMRWGYVPFWDKSPKPKIAPINARSEEAMAKAMFKQSIQQRRCLIPADGFYEWQTVDGVGKQPFSIGLADGAPFFFAGIFEAARETLPAMYLLFTTTSNEVVAQIHNRMPAMLTGERAKGWLEPGEMSPETFREFTAPFPADAMAKRPVSSLVNSPTNDTPLIFGESEKDLF